MRRASPEQSIQRAVFQHLRQRAAAGVFAFHVPNGGYRKPKEAAIMKGLGVVAGVPDVICIYRGSVYALELKAENGKPTAKQYEAVERIRDAGGFACICHGLDRAIKVLETWGILRGGIIHLTPQATKARKAADRPTKKPDGWLSDFPDFERED